MNTLAECKMKFVDAAWKRRHLKLLHELRVLGVRVAVKDDKDNWEVLLPDRRFAGWIAFIDLEPQMGEWVILRMHGGSVFEGQRCGLGHFDYQDREHRVYSYSDFSHWMTKP